jgi:hypothetical protein
MTLLGLLTILNLGIYAANSYGHQPRKPSDHSLRSLERWNVKRIRHAGYVLRFFERHPKILYAKRTSNKAWRIVHAHQKMRRHARARLAVIRQRMSIPPHYSFWLCVHRQEATWTDPNSPYYGGLQMGNWFMRTYGWNLLQRKGTANNWTPMEQIWVAERAWKREGYSYSWLYGQWPNTAPPCT